MQIGPWGLEADNVEKNSQDVPKTIQTSSSQHVGRNPTGGHISEILHIRYLH